MPRPKKEGAPEPKKRSRNGCWPCKARKVKCGEEKPDCLNCKRQGESCDYSIRLNWGGRAKKKSDAEESLSPTSTFATSPHMHTSSFQVTSGPSGKTPQFAHSQYSFLPRTQHSRSHSNPTVSRLDTAVDSSLGSPSASSQTQSAVSPKSKHGTRFHFSPVFTRAEESLQTQMNNVMKAATSAPVDQRTQNASYRETNLDFLSTITARLDENGHHNGSRTFTSGGSESSHPSLAMPPPIRASSSSLPHDLGVAFQDPFEANGHRTKRVRLSPTEDAPSPSLAGLKYELFSEKTSLHGPDRSYSPGLGSITPHSFANTPRTPGSSANSEDGPLRHSRTTGLAFAPHGDLHRLSVSSLLSGPPSADGSTQDSINGEVHGRQYPIHYPREGYTTYGYDVGDPDFDTPHNNDHIAIRQFSPPATYHGRSGYDSPSGFNDHRAKDNAFEKGGYYAKPVPIKIAKELEPLPSKLLDHPMNLLYFHHFINHTARILVAHDCEDNPFQNVLPKLAVRDDNILDLLLAFSASHRARLLGHREPANRIAHWVQDVFPQLRRSIDLTNNTPNSSVSDSSLTTAIMLVSLEIISPSAFEVPIPWQNHLKLARQMIMARGGLQSIHRRDLTTYFLSRWFAYLDVLGSLSGSKNDRPLASTFWVSDDLEDRGEWRIDCFFGFTARCVGLLARIAELAKTCEDERFNSNGDVRANWLPSPQIAVTGEKLRQELVQGRDRVYKGCPHRPSMPHSGSHITDDGNDEHEAGWDSLEIFSTNAMFHSAGLIHLLRRVLGKPRNDPEVQENVNTIIEKLGRLRKGGTAEACVLFPLFTAGAEAIEKDQREKIMDRMVGVEGFGMIQVNKARTLMQHVWQTGQPWETHVSGEFFG